MASRDGTNSTPARWGVPTHPRDQAAVARPTFGGGRVPRIRPLVPPAGALPIALRPTASAPADASPLPVAPSPAPTRVDQPTDVAADKTVVGPVSADQVGRKTPRRAAMIPALLTYADFGNGMPCRILNMSVTGALVELPRPDQGWYDSIENIPANITLRLKLDRMERDALIVRRSGREIGVRFTTAARPMKAAR